MNDLTTGRIEAEIDLTTAEAEGADSGQGINQQDRSKIFFIKTAVRPFLCLTEVLTLLAFIGKLKRYP